MGHRIYATVIPTATARITPILWPIYRHQEAEQTVNRLLNWLGYSRVVAIVRFVDVCMGLSFNYKLFVLRISINRSLYLSSVYKQTGHQNITGYTENFVWFANAEYYPFSHAVSKSR